MDHCYSAHRSTDKAFAMARSRTAAEGNYASPQSSRSGSFSELGLTLPPSNQSSVPSESHDHAKLQAVQSGGSQSFEDLMAEHSYPSPPLIEGSSDLENSHSQYLPNYHVNEPNGSGFKPPSLSEITGDQSNTSPLFVHLRAVDRHGRITGESLRSTSIIPTLYRPSAPHLHALVSTGVTLASAAQMDHLRERNKRLTMERDRFYHLSKPATLRADDGKVEKIRDLNAELTALEQQNRKLGWALHMQTARAREAVTFATSLKAHYEALQSNQMPVPLTPPVTNQSNEMAIDLASLVPLQSTQMLGSLAPPGTIHSTQMPVPLTTPGTIQSTQMPGSSTTPGTFQLNQMLGSLAPPGAIQSNQMPRPSTPPADTIVPRQRDYVDLITPEKPSSTQQDKPQRKRTFSCATGTPVTIAEDNTIVANTGTTSHPSSLYGAFATPTTATGPPASRKPSPKRTFSATAAVPATPTEEQQPPNPQNRPAKRQRKDGNPARESNPTKNSNTNKDNNSAKPSTSAKDNNPIKDSNPAKQPRRQYSMVNGSEMSNIQARLRQELKGKTTSYAWANEEVTKPTEMPQMATDRAAEVQVQVEPEPEPAVAVNAACEKGPDNDEPTEEEVAALENAMMEDWDEPEPQPQPEPDPAMGVKAACEKGPDNDEPTEEEVAALENAMMEDWDEEEESTAKGNGDGDGDGVGVGDQDADGIKGGDQNADGIRVGDQAADGVTGGTADAAADDDSLFGDD